MCDNVEVRRSSGSEGADASVSAKLTAQLIVVITYLIDCSIRYFNVGGSWHCHEIVASETFKTFARTVSLLRR